MKSSIGILILVSAGAGILIGALSYVAPKEVTESDPVEKKEATSTAVVSGAIAESKVEDNLSTSTDQREDWPEPKKENDSELSDLQNQVPDDTVERKDEKHIDSEEKVQDEVGQAVVDTSRTFRVNFSGDDQLEESSGPDTSESVDWWLNSGAFLFWSGGVARTQFGPLEKDSKWQVRYQNGARDIPSETDGGFYPQNIFRLLTQEKWKDIEQTVYFKIEKDNLSEDSHRSASNGLLLFHRYQDSDNLYYLGLRVDGAVVVKKKYQGSYETLAYQPLFAGEYDRNDNPNLLPKDTWLGVRGVVQNMLDGSVSIEVLIDQEKTGNWQSILTIVDDGSLHGPPLYDATRAGIRTDFMDVRFHDYMISEI